MRILKLLPAILFLGNLVHANTEVPDSALFAGKDSRGAYQEVHLVPISLPRNYFDKQDKLRLRLEEDVSLGLQTGYWTTATMGRLTFQEGELVADQEVANCKKLDPLKPFAEITAKIGFSSKEEAERGIYKVDGIVTLAASSIRTDFSENDEGERHAIQVVSAWCFNSDLFSRTGKMCGQFNEMGNGKNDGGRTYSIGVVSPKNSLNNLITVQVFRQAMGKFAQIFYP